LYLKVIMDYLVNIKVVKININPRNSEAHYFFYIKLKSKKYIISCLFLHILVNISDFLNLMIFFNTRIYCVNT